MKDKFKETLSSVLSYLLKVERRTLLWTNANPTATFAPQTVSLDLSSYDAVAVEFKAYPDLWIMLNAKTEIDLKGMCSMGRNDVFYVQNRVFSPTASGVAFENCTLGTNSSVYNNHNVPYKIYGIKYGGVLRKSVIAVLSAFKRIPERGCVA